MPEHSTPECSMPEHSKKKSRRFRLLQNETFLFAGAMAITWMLKRKDDVKT